MAGIQPDPAQVGLFAAHNFVTTNQPANKKPAAVGQRAECLTEHPGRASGDREIHRIAPGKRLVIRSHPANPYPILAGIQGLVRTEGVAR